MSLWGFWLFERHRLKIEGLKKWGNVSEEDKVLDVGGGLNKVTGNAFAIDKAGEPDLLVDMDVFETSELFDVVVMGDSLIYSRNPLALLVKVKGWLKDGGRIVLSVHNTGCVRQMRIVKPLLYSWDETALRFLLLEAGFSETRFSFFKFCLFSLPFDAGRFFSRRLFCEARKKKTTVNQSEAF